MNIALRQRLNEQMLAAGAPITAKLFLPRLYSPLRRSLVCPSPCLACWASQLRPGRCRVRDAVQPAAAQEDREIIIQRVQSEEKEDGDEGKKKEQEDDDDDRPKRAYWIGVALAGDEGIQGLTIRDVLPDSPALQAGLKAGDVLAAVGDKKMERLEQLVDLIQDSGGKPLE